MIIDFTLKKNKGRYNNKKITEARNKNYITRHWDVYISEPKHSYG